VTEELADWEREYLTSETYRRSAQVSTLRDAADILWEQAQRKSFGTATMTGEPVIGVLRNAACDLERGRL